MSPASRTPYNTVVPEDDRPSPGELDGVVGPGWSWTAFSTPWATGRPAPKYRWTLFATAAHAVDDLRRCLDDGAVSRRGALCASVLRKRGAPRELVLCDGADWAYVVHEVRPGAHLADAGDAYFDRWRATMTGHRFTIVNAGVPTVW
ncbi:hypothetical protein [Amycolatopsis regifaucium]|uniref:Uncharacterized protein n=1 Tax=Amycolatopsis regifaucium TaxID=546365 RepID=A0A154M632_9PSEU|nr:hypothetical protein [Amycolatopsis regifaucium]KZB79827.1 hypothetical protein AVL48_15720 [Amycolatopsis regifaucium]OKA09855.1 hypothetical protein ATP06_0205690 [Amycolatopsis regifaucium]SFJ33170.1 hypothetical protein SAMN04489731_11918 [Amycolatopsis regifaucium]